MDNFNAEESEVAQIDLKKLVEMINDIFEHQEKNSRQLNQDMR